MVGGLKNRVKFLLALIVLTGALHGVAKAQSLEEMKAELKALQKRIEQLEAAQRRHPAERAAPVAQRGPSAAETRAAQQAAEQARAAAAQAQQAAIQAQQEAAEAKKKAAAEVKAAYAPPPGKPGLSFRIPGTETTVRPYGFVKLNGSTDLTTQDRNDALTAQSIQLLNTPAQQIGGDTQFSARRSRIGIETWTPVNQTFGEFHTLIEMDFAGQNTSLTTQSTSSSYTPRLRKAYADFGQPTGGWGAFLFGQNDTLFSDAALLPIQWLSDWTFVGMDNVRQAQLRYTYGLANGISLAFGVESPYSDITTSAGTSFPDSNGGDGFGWQRSPDFTGRVLYKRDWGQLALRGVVRPQIDLNNNGASSVPAQFNRSVTGYGIGVTAVVNLLDGRLVLMGSGNAGNGLGRYLDATANGFGAVSNAGLPGTTAADTSLNAVGVYGGMLGAQYFFTPTLRTNMAIGGARLMMPSYTAQFGGCVGAASSSGTCSTVNTSEWAGSINLIWSPFKMIDLGFEYQHVERALQQRAVTGTNASAGGGIENRLQVTTIGRF